MRGTSQVLCFNLRVLGLVVWGLGFGCKGWLFEGFAYRVLGSRVSGFGD